jgi:drug/metabolite transporter (DMT)-like permease
MSTRSSTARNTLVGLVAVVLWSASVANLTVLAAMSYFTPVFSTLLASLWLGVRPGPSFWQGVVMVVAGSLMCWWSTRRGQA